MDALSKKWFVNFKNYILLLFLSICLICHLAELNKFNEKQKFTIPIIIQDQSKDTLKLFQKDYLDVAWFKLVGKYKFTDSVNLDKTHLEDLEYELGKLDSINSDGLQIFVDYKTTIRRFSFSLKGNTWFPIFIVNETSQTKLFDGIDLCGFGLQEAIDTSRYKEWFPIESMGRIFCGNGMYELKINPGEFLILLAPKYEGSEKQKMRVRLKFGGSIYLSQPYEGTFNPKQFRMKNKT